MPVELDTITNICASAISDDGHWLAVSDVYEVRLFELAAPTGDEGSLHPRRLKNFAALLAPHLVSVEGAAALGFAPDSGRLVLAGARSGRVIVVVLTSRTGSDKPEPKGLRGFDHHTRRTASSGRVVKAMPTRTGADSEESEDANTDEVAQRFATADDLRRTHIFDLKAPTSMDSGSPSERACSLHLYFTFFKPLQSTAALKRPLLLKQASGAVRGDQGRRVGVGHVNVRAGHWARALCALDRKQKLGRDEGTLE